MLLAATSEAISTGNLVVGSVTLITLLGAVSYQFVMRREFAAHQQSTQEKFAEHDRRIVSLESQDSPTGDDYLQHARRNADAHTEIERKVSSEIAGVRHELGDIAKKVSSMEPELHWQSRLLRALANKLNIQIP